MSVHPWIKFYPRDWRGDQALRAVSIAARGLWIDCLCIMHEAKPYGHLVLNGQPVDDDTLARMTGVPVDEVSALMAELREAGVLSVTGKGVVFSRRMTRDHARAQKGKRSVEKRWAQETELPKQTVRPIRFPIRNPTTQTPEAKSQSSDPNGSAPSTAQEALTTTLWRLGPQRLVRLGLPEARARNQIGHWLKTNKPEEILRLIEQAERNGTRDPIPYITAALKPKDTGWRKNGTGYLVKCGSEPWNAWRSHLKRNNDPRQWEFVEKPGSEVQVPSLWPGGAP